MADESVLRFEFSEGPSGGPPGPATSASAASLDIAALSRVVLRTEIVGPLPLPVAGVTGAANVSVRNVSPALPAPRQTDIPGALRVQVQELLGAATSQLQRAAIGLFGGLAVSLGISTVQAIRQALSPETVRRAVSVGGGGRDHESFRSVTVSWISGPLPLPVVVVGGLGRATALLGTDRPPRLPGPRIRTPRLTGPASTVMMRRNWRGTWVRGGGRIGAAVGRMGAAAGRVGAGLAGAAGVAGTVVGVTAGTVMAGSILAVTAFAGAVAVATKALDTMTETIGRFSPEIQAARGTARVRTIQAEMAAAQRIGGLGARWIDTRTDLSIALLDLKTTLVSILAPVGVATVQTLIPAVTAIHRTLKDLQLAIVGIELTIDSMLSQIPGWGAQWSAELVRDGMKAAQILAERDAIGKPPQRQQLLNQFLGFMGQPMNEAEARAARRAARRPQPRP